MRLWRSLHSLYGRSKARSLEASVRLTAAYREVFQGSPSKEDQELVLADLKAKSGWALVSPPEVSGDMLRHREGMRATFGIIFSHLSLSTDDYRALENAARKEAALDQT